AAAPAAIFLILVLAAGGRLQSAVLRADAPAAVQALPADQQAVFFDDARAISRGFEPSLTLYAPDVAEALQATAARERGIAQGFAIGSLAIAALLAVGGFLFARRRLTP